MKIFCRNVTFLQKSDIALTAPFQITPRLARLPWSWPRLHKFPHSAQSSSSAHTPHISLSFLQSLENTYCRNKNQHANPKVAAYESVLIPRLELHIAKKKGVKVPLQFWKQQKLAPSEWSFTDSGLVEKEIQGFFNCPMRPKWGPHCVRTFT